MALRTPDEILNKLSVDRQALLDATMKFIEDEIEKKFKGAGLSIVLPDEPLDNYRIIEPEISRLLSLSEWKLVSMDWKQCGYNEYCTRLCIDPIPKT
jgi:hypothetical protein